ESGNPSDFNAFRKVCRRTKRTFFDSRIHEIASTNKRPWDLMNWIQQRKLPPAEAITYNGRPYGGPLGCPPQHLQCGL
ncbi:LOW QUALITY PROTEIN: hypothetical protein CVT26_001630, partial [Gymnopilus dilepis]